MRVDGQADILGQSAHFNRQNAFCDEALGVSAGDADTHDASCVRFDDHFCRTLPCIHGCGASRKFPGEAVDLNLSSLPVRFFFGQTAVGNLRVGVDHSRYRPRIEAEDSPAITSAAIFPS